MNAFNNRPISARLRHGSSVLAAIFLLSFGASAAAPPPAGLNVLGGIACYGVHFNKGNPVQVIINQEIEPYNLRRKPAQLHMNIGRAEIKLIESYSASNQCEPREGVSLIEGINSEPGDLVTSTSTVCLESLEPGANTVLVTMNLRSENERDAVTLVEAIQSMAACTIGEGTATLNGRTINNGPILIGGIDF